MLKNETLFKNFSSEDFEWKYDGVEYMFPAGSVKPLEKAEALHFAKHLVDREMISANLSTNHHSRPEFEAKATEDVPNVVVHTEPETVEEIRNAIQPTQVVEKEFVDLKEEKFCDFCDSRGVKHMKTCTRDSQKEFPDLESKA